MQRIAQRFALKIYAVEHVINQKALPNPSIPTIIDQNYSQSLKFVISFIPFKV